MNITINSGVTTYVENAASHIGSLVRIRLSGGTNTDVIYDVNYCGSFGCYYVGKRGGWNAFLFEGNCKRTDEVDRHKINKFYLNTTSDFGEKTYVSEITPTYELSTGWLNDRQSERFATDLMQSNTIYLHDLADDRIFPVEITDSKTLVKKFKDERKLISYTLNVEASQTRIRR